MKAKEVGKRAIGSLSLYIQNNPDIVKQAKETWSEQKRLNAELKSLEYQSKVKILEITKRYELCRDVLTHIFAERSTALLAHYNTLEKALSADDRELIIASLKGISTIVAQNPLESFAELAKVLDNDDEVLKLDF